MKLKGLSVISYSLMRLLPKKFIDAGDWQQVPESHFLVTGDIQRQKDKVRVTVQLVKATGGQQVWNHVYERKLAQGSVFEVQDEITSLVFQALKKSGFLAGPRNKAVSMMAVA
jgi:TolB-like protein